MNLKKILFLFLALLLPVLIFIFLKSFGKNEFTVPPLFEKAVEASHAECASLGYTVPYVVNDSALTRLTWGNNDSLTLVVFDDTLRGNPKNNTIQIVRFLNEFGTVRVNLISQLEDTDAQNGLQESGSTHINMSKKQFSIYRNCVFLLKLSDNATLVDRNGGIRGQYNLSDREDADRLILEMKILLKKY